MNKKAIDQILENNAFPDLALKAELIETHISWVILTNDFAFKIKKPIQYSFLSFSTLEKRKFYCEKELRLNKRLTDNVYLQVVPILFYEGKWTIEGKKGNYVCPNLRLSRIIPILWRAIIYF